MHNNRRAMKVVVVVDVVVVDDAVDGRESVALTSSLTCCYAASTESFRCQRHRQGKTDT